MDTANMPIRWRSKEIWRLCLLKFKKIEDERSWVKEETGYEDMISNTKD